MRNEDYEMGPKKDRTIWEDYIDKWMLFKLNGSTEIGKLNRITSDYLILNPHQGMRLRWGKMVNDIIDRDCGIPLHADFVYRVISEEEVFEVCKQINR